MVSERKYEETTDYHLQLLNITNQKEKQWINDSFHMAVNYMFN